METIFIPDKLSQMVPLKNDPMLNMSVLIKCRLTEWLSEWVSDWLMDWQANKQTDKQTDRQESKIWLEGIVGLKRNYRAAIVIDSLCSYFCDLIFARSI
jgi:hypothetical protein